MKRRSPCPGEYTVPVGEPHRPLTTRSSEVLPQPEGPTTNSPSALPREKLRSRTSTLSVRGVLTVTPCSARCSEGTIRGT